MQFTEIAKKWYSIIWILLNANPLNIALQNITFIPVLLISFWLTFRVIIDGEGSQTVFNGPESMIDMQFTTVNNYISGLYIMLLLDSLFCKKMTFTNSIHLHFGDF